MVSFEVIRDFACMALQKAEAQTSISRLRCVEHADAFGEAHRLLWLPLNPRHTAQAYDHVRVARKGMPGEASLLAKDVAIWVRELLVLQLTELVHMGNGCHETGSLRHFLNWAFDKEIQDELASQMFISFRNVSLLANNNETVVQEAENRLYIRCQRCANPLDPCMVNNLFYVYRQCAWGLREYKSRNKLRGRVRPPRKATHRVASPQATVLDEHLQQLYRYAQIIHSSAQIHGKEALVHVALTGMKTTAMAIALASDNEALYLNLLNDDDCED